MRVGTVLLLAVVVATALVATEARSINAKQQRCYGRLVADARNYNKDQAGRMREIKLIGQMINMVRRVGSVKLEEDVETEADVEEERKHRELHGRGGVMQLLHALRARLYREGRRQNINVHRRMRACAKMCVHNSSVALSRYRRSSSSMRRMRSLRNRARGRYQTRKSIRRQRIGGKRAATKLYLKKRNMLNKEIMLISKLLAMVNRLHGMKSVQEILAKAQSSEMEEMKPVISELQRVSPESKKVQRLLINLRNKLKRDKRNAWNRVVLAGRAIKTARRLERRAYVRYRNAHRRYLRAVRARKSMRAWYRRQVASCKQQSRYIRKLRRI